MRHSAPSLLSFPVNLMLTMILSVSFMLSVFLPDDGNTTYVVSVEKNNTEVLTGQYFDFCPTRPLKRFQVLIAR